MREKKSKKGFGGIKVRRTPKEIKSVAAIINEAKTETENGYVSHYFIKLIFNLTR
jgi:hypothetical protein